MGRRVGIYWDTEGTICFDEEDKNGTGSETASEVYCYLSDDEYERFSREVDGDIEEWATDIVLQEWMRYYDSDVEHGCMCYTYAPDCDEHHPKDLYGYHGVDPANLYG